MPTHPTFLVAGASGHTGRFVVRELLDRGVEPILAGRDVTRLTDSVPAASGLELRRLDTADPDSVAACVTGVDVVLNCAGPFLDTALPIAGAAVDAGAHYLDITAEQESARQLLVQLAQRARDAGVAVVPAVSFFGGLPDLMLTELLAPEGRAERVDVAVGLDRWWPTEGTRRTGERNTVPRVVISGGSLAPVPSEATRPPWEYPERWGTQDVALVPLSEVVMIAAHLEVGELRSWMNLAPLADLSDEGTAPPAAQDETGRSAQRFVVDVQAEVDGEVRRSVATGRDIYAVTAPLVVEAAAWLVSAASPATGALAPGAAFEAGELLRAVAASYGELTLTRA